MRQVAHPPVRRLLVDRLAVQVVAVDAERAAEDQVAALGKRGVARGHCRAGLRGQVKHDRVGLIAEQLEGARDSSPIGDVAFHQLHARRKRRLNRFARSRVEVVEGNRRWRKPGLAEPAEQGSANVPYAGQQRRHRRPF